MRPYTFAASGAPAGYTAPVAAPVQFSLLYRLHHTTCSVTTRHPPSPTRLTGPTSSPSTEETEVREEEEGETLYTTPHRSSARVPYHQHPKPLSSPLPVTNYQPHRTVSASVPPSHGSPLPSTALLSTMDCRELSKVIVRDAVYGRVLDLVPGREQVQVAVWTLSPHVVQIDGAVAACALLRDASVGCFADTSPHSSGRVSGVLAPSAADVRRVLQVRLGELALDAILFASLLKPYLGDVGCHGDVVYATVDGVSLLQ